MRLADACCCAWLLPARHDGIGQTLGGLEGFVEGGLGA